MCAAIKAPILVHLQIDKIVSVFSPPATISADGLSVNFEPNNQSETSFIFHTPYNSDNKVTPRSSSCVFARLSNTIYVRDPSQHQEDIFLGSSVALVVYTSSDMKQRMSELRTGLKASGFLNIYFDPWSTIELAAIGMYNVTAYFVYGGSLRHTVKFFATPSWDMRGRDAHSHADDIKFYLNNSEGLSTFFKGIKKTNIRELPYSFYATVRLDVSTRSSVAHLYVDKRGGYRHAVASPLAWLLIMQIGGKLRADKLNQIIEMSSREYNASTHGNIVESTLFKLMSLFIEVLGDWQFDLGHESVVVERIDTTCAKEKDSNASYLSTVRIDAPEPIELYNNYIEAYNTQHTQTDESTQRTNRVPTLKSNTRVSKFLFGNKTTDVTLLNVLNNHPDLDVSLFIVPPENFALVDGIIVVPTLKPRSSGVVMYTVYTTQVHTADKTFNDDYIHQLELIRLIVADHYGKECRSGGVIMWGHGPKQHVDKAQNVNIKLLFKYEIPSFGVEFGRRFNQICHNY